MQKISGTLPVGVVVGDELHKQFVMRTATVDDNIAATDEIVELGVAPTPIRLNKHIMARQVIKLGTLKPEQITAELLGGMSPHDWNELDRTSIALEKKLLRDGPMLPSAGGTSVAQSSSA